MQLIEFNNVGLQYHQGLEVFRNVTFSIPAGSFYFLTGPSGGGKTSLLRLIYADLMPTKGSVHVFSRATRQISAEDLSAFRRQIGVVYQEWLLIKHLTVLDNVALPLKLAGQTAARARQHARELLNWVGLDEQRFYMPHMLSGGQKQRVALARAVISQPLILLADEPTGNVDDAVAYRLIELLQELNRLGTTVIVATHDRGLAHRYPYPELYLVNGVLHHPTSDKVSHVA